MDTNIRQLEAGVRTAGIEYVDDWLQVRLLDRGRREDAEIRGPALQRLEWDSEIPDDGRHIAAGDAGRS
jgi:hypothetical protein